MTGVQTCALPIYHVDPATASAIAGENKSPLLLQMMSGGGGGSGSSDALNGTVAVADVTGGAMANPATAGGGAGAQGWTKAMTGAYAASYGFAYACTVLYALFFLVLMVFQKAVARQLAAPQRAAVEIGAVAAAGAPSALFSQSSAI